FARVFLAEQADLAGRPVVLKVSGPEGDEPQTLAQLQHTHIVPIYSVHEDRKAGLRAVCMPYFGGASLSQVLRALWAETDRPTTGEQLVRALAAAGTADRETRKPGDREKGDAAPLPAVSDPGHLEALGRMSYVRAAAWVVARLAEALQHAHERGVLHRDIKPSNVLLSADGQPMLLDFNLAQNLAGDQAQAHATLGGTVAYMSPEHLRAIATRDPALARLVGRPADVYSLGMVLYEMLVGHSPFDQSASYHPLPALIEAMAVERGKVVPSLRSQKNPVSARNRVSARGRPDAPWSLESIVRKCLAPDPARRYQQAEHLAEDLRRFLDDRPLKYAPELSRAERLRKWARRHPRLASSGTVAVAAAVLLLAAGTGLALVGRHLAHAREELKDRQVRERVQEFDRGTQEAFCLINTVSDGRDHLGPGIEKCEQTLGLFGVLDGDDWQQHPDWQRLGEDDRKRLAEDTHELLLLLAWGRARAAGGGRDALRDALALLEKAEAIDGAGGSPALWLDRASYLHQLGDQAAAAKARQRAAALPAAGARDHYLLATAHMRQRKYAEAVAELNEALRRRPRHYWSAFQRGLCHLQLRELTLAAADFSLCVGVWPDFAWGWFNRGYALQESGKHAEAVADYTAALERDPGFRDALWNRAQGLLALGRVEGALADLDRVAGLGRDDAALHAQRGLALARLGRHDEADRALRAALDRTGGAAEEKARVRLQFGFAVAARAPGKAAEAFEEVLRQRDVPAVLAARAYYGRAMLAAGAGHPEEAVRLLDQAVLADSELVEARRSRAVLLARAGRFAEANQDLAWCLRREPGAGATLYAAACVTALATEKFADRKAARQAADQSIGFLRQALARGYGREQAGADPDLAGVRDHPEFRKLLGAPPAGGR
ncbi:MAG TPA: tetratricopeptide repeat protein, partial [Gemmataceae bacterium]|nr:tetratricopeptide repeat protein [Gemmataceae bacterium]